MIREIRDPGSSRSDAFKIKNLRPKAKVFQNAIGGEGDDSDLYRFRLKNRSSFNAKLRYLDADADLALLNRKGKVIREVSRAGDQDERIKRKLNKGVYFINVIGQGEETPYRLRLSARSLVTPNSTPLTPTPIPTPIPTPTPTPVTNGPTSPIVTPTPSPTPSPLPSPTPTPTPVVPTNTAPSLLTNNGLTIGRGTTSSIDRGALEAADAEQSPDQLVFTLTSSPQAGTLFLNGTALGSGSSFTQDDINNNRILFRQSPIAKLPSDVPDDPYAPQASGNSVVWTASDGSDYEIFYYNGATGQTTQLTDNSTDDVAPQISGHQIVWQNGTGSNAEIYYYDGNHSPIQVTSDSVEDKSPKISGSTFTWQKNTGSNNQVYFSAAGGTPVVIDGSSLFDDTSPAISGSTIAFKRNDLNGDLNDGIYVYNTDTAKLDTLNGTLANTATSDNFGFNVSDGSLSTDGSFPITIS